MKKYSYLLLAAIFLAAGCSKEINSIASDDLVIGISAEDSKVSLGIENAGKANLLWSAGDEVSVKGDAGTSVFRLKSGAGSTSGVFEYKSGVRGHKVITDVVYPASKSGSTPTAQTYKAGTFDASALTLAYHNPSATADSKIILKSESSVLCFQLKGTEPLTSIKVAIKGGKTYTLSVPDVALSSTAKPFYIVVPAQKTDRVDVTFTSSSGSMNRILSSKSFVAGKLHKFAPLTYKADKSYRIMSYNIGQCTQGGNSSTKLIADVTKELSADVAVMNEVRAFPTDYSKIANALGWQHYFQKADNSLGNMVTYNQSKLKKVSEAYLSLKNIKNDVNYNEDRVCLFVEFEDLIIVGTHLETDDFAEHAKMITDKVKTEYAKKGKPILLCGDMNTRPYAEDMVNFTSEWRTLSKIDQATLYNSDQPDNLICIDYIFLYKGGPDVNVTKTVVCKSVNCGTITDASDHFPIYVDVTVGNSSLPLMEDSSSLGSFTVVDENTWL